MGVLDIERLHETAAASLVIAALLLSGGTRMGDAVNTPLTASGMTHTAVTLNPSQYREDSSRASPAFASGQPNALIADAAGPVSAVQTEGIATFTRKDIEIRYDLATGTADFLCEGQTIIRSFCSAARLPGLVTSRDYASRSAYASGPDEYTVISQDGSLPVMKQRFSLAHDDYFIVSLEMEGTDLCSNWMAPVVMDTRGGVDLGNGSDIIALWVPFDNDKHVTYEASSINREDTGYEVAAFYDNESRNGLVVGSVTHDTWKTGIRHIGSENRLDLLEVFGGASINNPHHNGAMARDVQEHGSVSGGTISSPDVFVGFFDDWRDGMEAYAEANAEVVPRLAWEGGVPFGWNSWGAVGSSLDTRKALAASEFIKDGLMGHGFENNGTVYINLDSYWDNPSVDLALFVNAVHENGQKAGIYWAPFADWAKDPKRRIEGSDYRYEDAWLRDSLGNPIDIDGAYAMDATHPGTKRRILHYIKLFKEKGFDEFIKLDFLSHGALEGRHHDPDVTTGIQAYNQGMRFVYEAITGIMGPNVFISQAISPLFPYHYAHSRRISCDKFGFLYESRSLLNSVAYGWWMNGMIYSFNDPDHMSLYGIWWRSSQKLTENEAKTRVTSAAISGTVFLSGDDFTDPAAQARALKYLTNPNINRIARMGRSFRPVEGNTGNDAPDIFVLDDGQNGFYIAVFNFNGEMPAAKIIDFERAGLDPKKTYTAVEQWSGKASRECGSMTVKLEPAEARVYLLR
jgi:hypothetical protein